MYVSLHVYPSFLYVLLLSLCVGYHQCQPGCFRQCSRWQCYHLDRTLSYVCGTSCGCIPRVIWLCAELLSHLSSLLCRVVFWLANKVVTMKLINNQRPPITCISSSNAMQSALAVDPTTQTLYWASTQSDGSVSVASTQYTRAGCNSRYMCM